MIDDPRMLSRLHSTILKILCKLSHLELLSKLSPRNITLFYGEKRFAIIKYNFKRILPVIYKVGCLV